MNEPNKIAMNLIDYAKLVITAMVMIYVVYFVAKELAGQVPATIGAVIIGIGSVYVYISNRKVKDEMNSWLKIKK